MRLHLGTNTFVRTPPAIKRPTYYVRPLFHTVIALLASIWGAKSQGQAKSEIRPKSGLVQQCCAIYGNLNVDRTPRAGITVVVEDTWSRKLFTTVTTASGAYSVTLPQPGDYMMHLELNGEVFGKQKVSLDPSSHSLETNFFLTRLPDLEYKDGSKDLDALWPSPIFAPASLSSLSMLPVSVNTGGNSGAQMPSFTGDASFSGDTFSVSGQAQIIDPFFQMDDQMRQYFEDGHQLQTFSLDPDSDTTDYKDIADSHTDAKIVASLKLNLPHGVVYWTGGNSALNANPYVLAGQPIENPSYNTNGYGTTIAGHPFVPHFTEPSRRDSLSVSFAGQSSLQLVNDFGTVPTEQERQGDFSALLGPTGRTAPIYSPKTHLHYPNNVIDTPLDPAAAALLAYIPKPNLNSSGLNYRLLTTQGVRANIIGASYEHQFDALPSDNLSLLHQSLYFTFNYGEIANDVVNIYPQLGGRQRVDGYSATAGYKVGEGSWMTNISVLSSRNNARLSNYFTNVEDIETRLGLYNDDFKRPINSNPMNYGLPNLVFNNYTGFGETQPNLQLTQRTGFSGAAVWIHGPHDVRFGADLNRIDFNIFGGTNATGTYVFTGGYTQDINTLGDQVPTSGSSFADFLTGYPQETKIESAAQKAYMRQANYDLYIRDDWQLLPNLTLLAGLRYDYYAPFVETRNRLSTLDYAPDFSNVAPVQPNGIGPISGASYSRSLINPDRNNISPHLGFAWAVTKDTTARAGYGISYTEAQYASFIQNLAYQPPFAHVESNGNIVDFLTFVNLQYGFGNMTDDGNYAVNRNYRLPYVQSWYLDLQQAIPGDIVLDVGYAGAKGTRLDVISAPGFFNNQSFSSAYFDFEDSTAFSNFNAFVVRANRRLSNGLAFEATYAFSHSIDNASSIEAGSSVVVQNWQNLLAEEGNSAFDIRHQLTASFLYQLPFGHGRPYLNDSRWLSGVFGDLAISGFATVATGMPLTPFIAASVSEVQRGTHGSVRPNRVPGSSIMAGGGHLNHWFNTAAFSSDFAPNQEFGTASRYSIPGPGLEVVNLSISKTMSFESSRSLELRATANNAFNIVQYAGVNTQISSSTFGYVDAVQPMRQLTFIARFHF